MNNKKWSKVYSQCVICKTTEVKYHCRGMCTRCYDIWRYHKDSKRRIQSKESSRRRRENNPEKNKKYCKEYCELNKESAKKRAKDWYYNNLERVKEYQKKYKLENSEKLKKRKRKYREENPEKIKEQRKKHYKENSEKILEKNKKWRKENSEKIKEYNRKYFKNKRLTNPRYKLKRNISTAVHNKLKLRLSSKKGKSTWDFLPYTLEELMSHLESLFTAGMTWENYGMFGWHIDHKKPESLFNYSSVTDKEFQKCWALKNLQPLWWLDNIKKGNKY